MPGGLVGQRLLTLQEAADQLKVHYMTAYRWVRKGELPAFKAGGRLRVRAEDLRQFVDDREVDVALPALDPGRTNWDTHIERLHELLLEGAGVEAGSLVRKVIADGAPAGDVYVHLLTPALYRVGADWEAQRVGVAVEHRATEIVAGLMARLATHFRRRGPSRGTAVTLTPPIELHVLGVAMVADVLRAGGYDVHHLGANVPFQDLALFLQVVPTDLVCVSITGAEILPDTYDKIVAAAGGARVLVGGQGTDGPRLRSAGAEHVPDLAALPEHLSLVDGGP